MRNECSASYDPDWQERHSELVVTADEAVAHVQPGHRVFIGTGCAQPQELVRALVGRSRDLTDTEIVHLLTLGDAPYADQDLAAHFSVNSFFIAPNVRDVIQEGLGDYTPIFLSDIPRLFNSGQLLNSENSQDIRQIIFKAGFQYLGLGRSPLCPSIKGIDT